MWSIYVHYMWWDELSSGFCNISRNIDEIPNGSHWLQWFLELRLLQKTAMLVTSGERDLKWSIWKLIENRVYVCVPNSKEIVLFSHQLFLELGYRSRPITPLHSDSNANGACIMVLQWPIPSFVYPCSSEKGLFTLAIEVHAHLLRLCVQKNVFTHLLWERYSRQSLSVP